VARDVGFGPGTMVAPLGSVATPGADPIVAVLVGDNRDIDRVNGIDAFDDGHVELTPGTYRPGCWECLWLVAA